MTDIVLKDIEPILADRIKRVAQARGWSIHETIFNLLEQGLFHSESEVRGGFDSTEVDVLSEAINILREMPAGKGF